MKIVWKEVKGYEGYYEISSNGIVRNIKTGRRLKPDLHKEGYDRVTLSKDGVSKHLFNHRLVAISFLPNEENHPVVNHIDGNRQNNAVENLEWCSHKHNAQHAIKLGLKTIKTGEDCSYAKLSNDIASEIIKDIKSGKKYAEISEEREISQATISMIKTGKRWNTEAIKVSKGSMQGSANPSSKLTEDDVREIFELLKQGIPQNEIGERYGVVKGLISDIARRKSWSHVETDYVYAPKKSKLSEEDIIKITEYAKNRTYTRKELGNLYGVSKGLIDKVLRVLCE